MPREFNLELDPSVDKIFDETPGNSFLAVRKLRWNQNSEFKLDIRKWFTNSNGEEIAGKGVSFMENNAGWHGKAPNDEEYATAMADLQKIDEELGGAN